MPFDTEEYLRRLQVIGESDAVVPLRQATLDALGMFGVSAAFFIAPMTQDVRVGRTVTNMGLPWVWERHYRARLYKIDPLPKISLEKLAAFRWPDQIDLKKLSRKERRYLDIAAQYGLTRGVGVACFGPNGRAGFLGAVLDAETAEPDNAALQRIHTIGQVSFQTYCRLVQSFLDAPALSNRELEVLHWIGQGKSNSVVAEILGISPSSVDVYVRRIFGKLDVTDRTTASVKAYSLGLIISGDYQRFLRETAARQAEEADDDGAQR